MTPLIILGHVCAAMGVANLTGAVMLAIHGRHGMALVLLANFAAFGAFVQLGVFG